VREDLARLVARIALLVEQRAAQLDEDSPRLSGLESIVQVLTQAHLGPGDDSGTGPSALAEIGDVFGLDEDESRFLLIAAAPHIDDSFGIAYDLLCGGHGAGLPTAGVALELCDIGTGTAAAYALLAEEGLLRKHRLITIIGEGSRLRRHIVVAEPVLGRLLSAEPSSRAVEAMRCGTVPITDARTPEIVRALQAGTPLIWLHSPGEAPGTAVAAGAFAAAGVDSLTIDLRRAPAGTTPADALTSATLIAGLTGRGLVVTGIPAQIGHMESNPGFGLASIVEVMRRAAVPVIAVSPVRWHPEWAEQLPLLLDVKPLAAADRARLWGEVTGDPDIAAAVIALRMTPDDIQTSAHYAQQLAVSRGLPAITAPLLREAAQAMTAGGGVDVMSTRPREALTFDDLVVADAASADLRRMIRWGRVRDGLVHAGQVHGKAGKGIGLLALFTGSPGTGKTMAAHVVADELGLELMQVNLASVVDKYIGETEKHLERVFAQAEARNVVLFFDEADSLFGSRSDVKDARDRYANQEVSYLLQRMEHYDGIAILATNLRGNLDHAFTRRLNLIVHFPDPDENIRAELWRRHLAEAGDPDPDDPVDVARLAAVADIAGGDIRNIVLGACYDAFGQGERMGMRHITEATIREFRKLGRRDPAKLPRG
jgi:AAA+ superfamily predicted ATPase